MLTQAELQLQVSQVLALFVKIIKKMTKRLLDVQKAAISATLPDANAVNSIARTKADGSKVEFRPLETTLEQELEEAGDEATRVMREKQRAMIDALDLSK